MDFLDNDCVLSKIKSDIGGDMFDGNYPLPDEFSDFDFIPIEPEAPNTNGGIGFVSSPDPVKFLEETPAENVSDSDQIPTVSLVRLGNDHLDSNRSTRSSETSDDQVQGTVGTLRVFEIDQSGDIIGELLVPYSLEIAAGEATAEETSSEGLANTATKVDEPKEVGEEAASDPIPRQMEVKVDQTGKGKKVETQQVEPAVVVEGPATARPKHQRNLPTHLQNSDFEYGFGSVLAIEPEEPKPVPVTQKRQVKKVTAPQEASESEVKEEEENLDKKPSLLPRPLSNALELFEKEIGQQGAAPQPKQEMMEVDVEVINISSSDEDESSDQKDTDERDENGQTPDFDHVPDELKNVYILNCSII